MNIVPQSTERRPEPPEESACCGRPIMSNRTFWLVMAAVALITSLTVNWNWLAAAGVVPLLLVLLPCGAMCAFRLCSRKGDDSEPTGRGHAT